MNTKSISEYIEYSHVKYNGKPYDINFIMVHSTGAVLRPTATTTSQMLTDNPLSSHGPCGRLLCACLFLSCC